MTALDQLRRLWEHSAWADAAMIEAIQAAPTSSLDALREFAHILGAEENWLARIEGREPNLPIWPELQFVELAAIARRVHAGYSAFLATLTEGDPSRRMPYTNSVGKSFETPLGDILIHVALHGQYHRGKVNLILRQQGASPAPVDYIGFVRGAPAARSE